MSVASPAAAENAAATAAATGGRLSQVPSREADQRWISWQPGSKVVSARLWL